MKCNPKNKTSFDKCDAQNMDVSIKLPNDGGYPSKVEPYGAPCVSKIRGVSWTRNKFNLTKLARLRLVEKLTMKEIMARMVVSKASVKRGLRKLQGGALVDRKA